MKLTIQFRNGRYAVLDEHGACVAACDTFAAANEAASAHGSPVRTALFANKDQTPRPPVVVDDVRLGSHARRDALRGRPTPAFVGDEAEWHAAKAAAASYCNEAGDEFYPTAVAIYRRDCGVWANDGEGTAPTPAIQPAAPSAGGARFVEAHFSQPVAPSYGGRWQPKRKKAAANEEAGRWVTMHGSPVFIKEGQTGTEALEERKGAAKEPDTKKAPTPKKDPIFERKLKRLTTQQSEASLAKLGYKQGRAETKPDASGKWVTSYEVEDAKGGKRMWPVGEIRDLLRKNPHAYVSDAEAMGRKVAVN